MPDAFDLRIPPSRPRWPLVDFMAALRAEHRLCNPLPGLRSSLSYEQHDEGTGTVYVVTCSCSGRWTHPRLVNPNPNTNEGESTPP